MPAKPLTKVVATFEVAEKLAPQLVDILRAVPTQFPCSIDSIVTDKSAPEGTPEATVTPKRKRSFLERITGKGQ